MNKDNKTVPTFQTIALKNVKTKENKIGTLQDLFKCIESIDQSRISLYDYSTSIQDSSQIGSLEKCLAALKKIEDHLLGMARTNISATGVKTDDPNQLV